MIKINLIQRPGSASGAKLDEAAARKRTAGIYALASVVICFGLVASFYLGWSHQISELNSRIAVARVEAARLAGIEAQNRRFQDDLAQIENHIAVIQTLEKSRSGPQELMAKLGKAAGSIAGLYLLSMKSHAGQLAIDGQSDRVRAIADFITALQSDRSFQHVQLHQVLEDDQNSRVSFKFGLVCLYTPPVETAASIPPAAPAGGSGRPPGR